MITEGKVTISLAEFDRVRERIRHLEERVDAVDPFLQKMAYVDLATSHPTDRHPKVRSWTEFETLEDACKELRQIEGFANYTTEKPDGF